MSNVLTQAEIDDLLNALSSGNDESAERPVEEGSLKVKVYDFRTANKFPKEQIRTLNIIFESFGQLLSNQLAGILRTTCEADVLSVEEQTFQEFSNALPSPVMLTIMKMEPLYGSVLFEMSPEVSYAIVDRVFGGSSGEIETGKQFTEIELTMIERVIRQLLPSFEGAWAKVLKIRPYIDRIETSPQFAQIVAVNETIAIVTINLTIGGDSGIITVCIPHVAIEPVAKQLNTRMWFSGWQESRAVVPQIQDIQKKLVHASVDLSVYFKPIEASVSEILHLNVGDVIQLRHRLDEPLCVNVQHIPKFHAAIGVSQSKYAIQIVNIIKGENEDGSESTTR